MNLKLICSFLFLVLLLPNSWLKANCSQPQPDKNKEYIIIENFIEYVVKAEFAYTLWGDKPMSVLNYALDFDLSSDSIKYGFEVWKENEHLYPSKNFVMMGCVHGPVRGYDTICIWLVNKSATLNIIDKHLQAFQQILKLDHSAEQILDKMLKNWDFFDLVTSDQELLGTLLGYGHLNSFYFSQMCKNHKQCLQKTKVPLKEDPNLDGLLMGQPNRESFSLEGSCFELEKFYSPCFVTFKDDEENKTIKYSFKKTREKLFEVYKNKNFFEVTIEQWMKGA